MQIAYRTVNALHSRAPKPLYGDFLRWEQGTHWLGHPIVQAVFAIRGRGELRLGPDQIAPATLRELPPQP